MTTLDIISDPICPWCHIGKAQFDRAVAAHEGHPFEIRWRPFQLNPDMPREGADRRGYLEAKFGGPEQAAKVYARIDAAARDAGIEMDFAAIERTPNTLDAHRLIHWARAEGAQHAVAGGLFDRYFHRGADISDPAVLAEVAEEAGLDRAVVETLLAGDADLELVREEDVAAREMGVSGVPTFIIGGRYALQGAQSAETWAKVIEELAAATT